MFDFLFSNADIIYACDPVSAMLAISALTTAANYKQSSLAAEAAEAQQKVNMDSMMKQGVLAQSDIQARKTEGTEASQTEREGIRVKAMDEVAKVRVSGLEAGIDGVSYEAILDEFDMHETKLMHASYLNEGLAHNRYAREGERLSMATEAKMKGAAVPIHQPSAAAATLEFAGKAANTYLAYGSNNEWGSWFKGGGKGGVDPNNFSLGHPNNPHPKVG